MFPHPAYREDNFTSVFSIILPLCTVLSFVMLCPAILKRVVEEKETGVKVYMFEACSRVKLFYSLFLLRK
jgi:ATP-binding cassette subfamily A (ABC1) protein 3